MKVLEHIYSVDILSNSITQIINGITSNIIEIGVIWPQLGIGVDVYITMGV
jgi:hypothetical protein